MLSPANMPNIHSDAYALLESSFQTSPNLSSHKSLPHRSDELRSILPEALPPPPPASLENDDETASQVSSQHTPPLASPAILDRTGTGLPPTPPSNSVDQVSPTNFSPPPHSDSIVSSLTTKPSSRSTPVNNRSPPTPDPSPPRTTESLPMTPAEPLERPPIFAYPSSRAESFKTAREDQYSSDGGSRLGSPLASPLADRLSTVAEERGLGLAFEREDGDTTPTNKMQSPSSAVVKDIPLSQGHKDPLEVEDIPNREWDTNLMRNVTVRRKRDPKLSPRKNSDPVTASSPTTGSPRRSSSLRERIEASKNSPQTASIENFARSIGWPAEANSMPNHQPRDVDTKRLSTSSATSTVVEAMVIVTPPQPQRRRTLRHSGKNLAYRPHGDQSAEYSPTTLSNRDSLNSDDYPLHRLVHKRATLNGSKRISSESDSTGLGEDRLASPLSIRKRGTPIDSRAHTLAHQESIRRVLQPAADIMSRSNSISRSYVPSGTFHKRISSAPETSGRAGLASPPPRTHSIVTSQGSPKINGNTPAKLPSIERTSPLSAEVPSRGVPSITPKVHTTQLAEPRVPPNFNKSLPELPTQPSNVLPPEEETPAVEEEKHGGTENQAPLAFHDALSEQPNPETDAQIQERQPAAGSPGRPTHVRQGSSGDRIPSVRRGSLSTRGRSEERRRSFNSQDRSSTSRDALRPSMDRIPTEDLPRHSHEWQHTHGRVSFDRSTIQSDEHAMARHLFAQTTPFSQFSDTPIEVSEATAVSIFPHNNHSLLVVQQPARGSMLPSFGQEVVDDVLAPSSNPHVSNMASSALLFGDDEQQNSKGDQPTLHVEPSTPPMKLSLPIHVDSPLKNPRAAPEPPVIQFIPPTPAEELERQLPPGPPKRSESHPQRRLTLVQRARRYSGNFISPLLARASSTRSRRASESHVPHGNPRIPTVNDQDGSLHPFWRPRGFWDGFDDSDTESEDDVLPEGGDTSDVPEPEPEPIPRKLGSVLGRRFSIKGSGGFLIGNSLGVERHGTNKRKPHIILPSSREPEPEPESEPQSPKILIHPATAPLRIGSPHRVEKRGSRTSMHSNRSSERPHRGSRRDAWRRGRNIPGVPRLQVQYIGISGVKERFRERKAEKRRDEIRKSIGSRYYYEGGTNVT